MKLNSKHFLEYHAERDVDIPLTWAHAPAQPIQSQVKVMKQVPPQISNRQLQSYTTHPLMRMLGMATPKFIFEEPIGNDAFCERRATFSFVVDTHTATIFLQYRMDFRAKKAPV